MNLTFISINILLTSCSDITAWQHAKVNGMNIMLLAFPYVFVVSQKVKVHAVKELHNQSNVGTTVTSILFGLKSFSRFTFYSNVLLKASTSRLSSLI